MPAKIQMIVTDPDGKLADREIEISDQQWEFLKEGVAGWKKRGIKPNPDYDPNLPEDETNKEFLDVVSDRWHIIDQAQKYFERLYRNIADNKAKKAAKQQVEDQAKLAKAAMKIKEKGDKKQ